MTLPTPRCGHAVRSGEDDLAAGRSMPGPSAAVRVPAASPGTENSSNRLAARPAHSRAGFPPHAAAAPCPIRWPDHRLLRPWQCGLPASFRIVPAMPGQLAGSTAGYGRIGQPCAGSAMRVSGRYRLIRVCPDRGGVRERRRCLAADNRRCFMDQLVVLDGRHHEQGKVHTAGDVAGQDGVAHVPAPHGKALALAFFELASAHDGPPRIAGEHAPAGFDLVV